jgi:RNA polymerase sigma-B factor
VQAIPARMWPFRTWGAPVIPLAMEAQAVGRKVTRDRTRELAEFREYARSHDPRLREILIEERVPLAASIARRYAGARGAALEDLEQVANVALIKAVDRFDPDRGSAFSTYAVPTIQGELRRYFRDHTWSVRPPRELMERSMRIDRERDRMTKDLGRNPTVSELAASVECTPEEVVEAAEAANARFGDSLDRPAGARDDDGAATVGELIGGPEHGFEAAEAAATVERLLAVLPERERAILRMRFREDLTQAEIGRRVGCSQMQVSRLLRRALTTLRDAAG